MTLGIACPSRKDFIMHQTCLFEDDEAACLKNIMQDQSLRKLEKSNRIWIFMELFPWNIYLLRLDVLFCFKHQPNLPLYVHCRCMISHKNYLKMEHNMQNQSLICKTQSTGHKSDNINTLKNDPYNVTNPTFSSFYWTNLVHTSNGEMRQKEKTSTLWPVKDTSSKPSCKTSSSK